MQSSEYQCRWEGINSRHAHTVWVSPRQAEARKSRLRAFRYNLQPASAQGTEPVFEGYDLSEKALWSMLRMCMHGASQPAGCYFISITIMGRSLNFSC